MHTEKTMTFSKGDVEVTIDSDGNVLQEYNQVTGVTVKYFIDAKEVYFPKLRMYDRYKHDRYGNYTLDYSTFMDIACLSLKVWYDVNENPSSYAIGEIITNSEYSKMKYSARKPILDIAIPKVSKFISHWRDGRFYDISLLVSKIDPQGKTTQQSFVDKVNQNIKNLPIL